MDKLQDELKQMRTEMEELETSVKDHQDIIQYAEGKLEKTLQNHVQLERRHKSLLAEYESLSLHMAVSQNENRAPICLLTWKC